MGKTPVVLGFLFVIFLIQLAAQSQVAVWAYYNRLVFGWSEFQIGMSVALFGLMLAIVQGGLTGPVIARLGAPKTSLLGLTLALPAYPIFAFAPGGWAMYVGILIGCLSGMTFPAIQQMMSERISEDAQGELQGAVASMISITSIIGPVMMTMTFGAFADQQGLYLPGAPYLLAASIIILGIALLRWNLSMMARG